MSWYIEERRERRERQIEREAEARALTLADEPALPTDAEVDALSAALVADVAEFNEREAFRARWQEAI